MIVTIVSPSAEAVKPRRHPRIFRADIPAPEIDPALKAALLQIVGGDKLIIPFC